MKLHLDTDLGSDPDDVCALAMLLGTPGVELTGITTVIDPAGRRAGFVERCLQLAGRSDVPLAAGAEASITALATPGDIPPDDRYWGGPVTPRPSSVGAALDLLDSSLEQGAGVVAIGPYTNLALLEIARPGRLASTSVVVMGGWVRPPSEDLPSWGPARDWNVQCDTRAAEIVARAAGELTLVPLAATAAVHLREVHLDRLEAAGPLGHLLAVQARAYAEDQARAELAQGHAGLPADLLNFQHDPLACAVAAGWTGVTSERIPLSPAYDGSVLRFRPHPGGRTMTLIAGVDSPAFDEFWLGCVERAARPAVQS